VIAGRPQEAVCAGGGDRQTPCGFVLFIPSPDTRQQLTMTGVAGAEKIKDSTLDCMASPTSKALRESRPRRLMSLALPVTTQFDNIVVPVQ